MKIFACLLLSVLFLLTSAQDDPAPLAVLFPSDADASDSFGISVIISQSLVFIGASFKQVGQNPSQGQAYIFNCTIPTACIQLSTLTDPNGVEEDLFGYSIAVSGDLVVVGAMGFWPSSRPGRVFVYDCQNPSACIHRSTLMSGSREPEERFGYAVAVSGSLVAVGCGSSVASPATVYVFDCRNASACTMFSVPSPDPSSNSLFGSALAFSPSGSVLAIGAIFLGGPGAVYLYECTNFSCISTALVRPSDGSDDDGFGSSVAISDTRLVVGSNTATVGANENQGKAYVFKCPRPFVCEEASILVGSDGAEWDNFGSAVALEDDRVVVSAIFKNNDEGQVYLFDCLNPFACAEKQRFTVSSEINKPHLGYSIAISRNFMVFGAIWQTLDPEHEKHGAAYFYR